jgi:translation initiation factor 3 subunit M
MADSQGLTVDELAYDLVLLSNKVVTGESADSSAFFQKCRTFKGQTVSLLTNIFKSTEHDLLAATDADNEIEGCFNIAGSMAIQLEEADRKGLVDMMIEIATGNVDDKALLRLRIVVNFYNILDKASAERFAIFKQIVHYAANSGHLDMLYNHFKTVESNMETWGLGVEGQRELYLLLSDVLAGDKSNDKSKDSQDYLIKYLSTFEAGTAGAADVKARASQAIVGAIKTAEHSFSQNEGLIRLAAVSQLEGDKEHGTLFDLLKIFSESKLETYLVFQKKNEAYMKARGIDSEKCVKSMRLLSLCSLASEHEEIPYATIAQTLQVEADQVEEWVVHAITSKFVEAKMDQLKQVVVINSAAPRVFGTAEWDQLSKKLTAWKSNVGAMLQTIENSKK